jgi:hypothetical protein
MPAPVESAAAAVKSWSVKTVTVVSIVAVEPRAGADENSANEPIWPIVAVGRACVGIVSIVAVGTYGSRAGNVCRAANANAHEYSLRVRIGCGKEENSRQSQES